MKLSVRQSSSFLSLSIKTVLVLLSSLSWVEGWTALISVCPKVEHVYIVTSDTMTSTTLLSLLDLEQVREFHICNELGLFSLPAKEHLGPVLQKHGETLVSLYLAEVKQIDVEMLCDSDFCPNLVHLALLWNNSYITQLLGKTRKQFKRSFFPKLLTVEIDCLHHGARVTQTWRTPSSTFGEFGP